MTVAVCVQQKVNRLAMLRRQLRETWLDFLLFIEVMLDAWLELEEKPGPRPVYPPAKRSRA